MNVRFIKEHIINNDYIEKILQELNCHNIKKHSNYYTFSNPDGNNRQAATLYLDNLSVINYTRTLPTPSDIFNLVQFYKEMNFFQALKWVCQVIDLDPYAEEDPDLSEAVKRGKLLLGMSNGKGRDEEDNTPIKPIDSKILSYYKTPCMNDMFLKDGISYSTQKFFEIGYDSFTNRITIPIRDETGVLCGVKGRLFKEELSEDDLKYLYLEPCSKSKILYNYSRSHEYIKSKGCVYVGESEKFCAQLWSYGYKNSISLGGSKISKIQAEKLIRLNVDLIFCMDKDVERNELDNVTNQFIEGVNIYAVIDENNILEPKESPSDSFEKWQKLIKNIKRIR